MVELRGDLDLCSAHRLSAVHRLVEGRVVLLDLSGVTFMDASGFWALVGLRRDLAEAGRWLFLERPSPVARRVIDLCEQLRDEQQHSFGVSGYRARPSVPTR